MDAESAAIGLIGIIVTILGMVGVPVVRWNVHETVEQGKAIAALQARQAKCRCDEEREE